VKPVLLNGMQNLREHQLSFVGLVVPFWIAVEEELEIKIL
jgi:hypothetical protein